MKYVLEEYLSSKSKDEIIELLSEKFKVFSNAQELLMKYYNFYHFEEDPKLIKKYKKILDKANEEQFDCVEWLRAAYPSFSPSYWDDMVIKAGGSLECYSYSSLND